jgi:prepilin-type N-terminal cleavage/methylation domain-containing protein
VFLDRNPEKTAMYAHQRRSAFSLIELVIVIVIIGIIGAIAIPRMSRGASGAADSALKANLALLRNAVDLFHTEHGKYPPAADIDKCLTMYSNEAATTFSATKTTTEIFGPYLRAVPPLPVGAKKNSTGIATADGAGVGWIYVEASGAITANTTASEKDDRGVLYSTY